MRKAAVCDFQVHRVGIAADLHLDGLGAQGRIPGDGQVAHPAVGGLDKALIFQRGGQGRGSVLITAGHAEGSHAALLDGLLAQVDGRLDGNVKGEQPGLRAGNIGRTGCAGAGDAGYQLGGVGAGLGKAVAAELGQRALKHDLFVHIGNGQLGGIIGRADREIGRERSDRILQRCGDRTIGFGVGTFKPVADDRHMPLVGRGLQHLPGKGHADIGQHVGRGIAVQVGYAKSGHDQHKEHHQQQPLGHAGHAGAYHIAHRGGGIVAFLGEGVVVVVRAFRSGGIVHVGHDLLDRKLHRAGHIQQALFVDGRQLDFLVVSKGVPVGGGVAVIFWGGALCGGGGFPGGVSSFRCGRSLGGLCRGGCGRFLCGLHSRGFLGLRRFGGSRFCGGVHGRCSCGEPFCRGALPCFGGRGRLDNRRLLRCRHRSGGFGRGFGGHIYRPLGGCSGHGFRRLFCRGVHRLFRLLGRAFPGCFGCFLCCVHRLFCRSGALFGREFICRLGRVVRRGSCGAARSRGRLLRPGRLFGPGLRSGLGRRGRGPLDRDVFLVAHLYSSQILLW